MRQDNKPETRGAKSNLSKEEWLLILQSYKVSGLSMKQFSEEEGLPYNRVNHWYTKYNLDGSLRTVLSKEYTVDRNRDKELEELIQASVNFDQSRAIQKFKAICAERKAKDLSRQLENIDLI